MGDIDSVVRLSERVSDVLQEHGVRQYMSISESLTGEPEPTVMVMIDDLGPEGVVDVAERGLEESGLECDLMVGQNGDGSIFIRVRAE